MAWLRFDRTRGLNLDQCTEWVYEDRVVIPEPPAGSLSAGRLRGGQQPVTKPVDESPSSPPPPASLTPGVVAAVGETSPGELVAPVTVPTLRLRMRSSAEVVLEGEQATKALAYLVGLTGAL